MKQCYVTGKKTIFGRTHTHHRGVAGGRWKKRAQKVNRSFKPNLQKTLIFENGELKQVYLATKVLKRVRKDIADGKRPFVEVVKLMPESRKARVMEIAGKNAETPSVV